MRYVLTLFKFWFAGIICVPSLVMAQHDPNVFLGHYVDKRDHFNAYTSKVDLDLKYFNSDATERIAATVEIVRAPQDTIFGAWMYIETDSLIFIYNHGLLYRVDKQSKTAETANASEKPGLWIASTWVNNFTEQAFIIKNQGARTILSNAAIRHRIVDTLINDQPCMGFYYFPPDEEEFTNQYVFVAIDTAELMVQKRITSIWFQENEQYQAWTYHQPTYGFQTELTLLTDSIQALLSMAKKYESYKAPDSLVQTIDYASLKGRIMGTTDSIDLSDLDADVILLDFWYSSCYPCMKTIPEVNKLYDRFKDRKVDFYGVNIIDDEIANKARIEKYVRNNPMKYQTIMADSKLYASWVPDGYPTLLILDKNFQLIQNHTGFTEDMADELTKVIEEHLNK